MQIESIAIKNYRLFRDVRMEDIPRLCVLVGANGTGKSTLFDVFSFLKDALSMNVTKALARRGGYREVASRGHTGDPIEITLQFRMEITGRERLVTYLLRIGLDARNRRRSNVRFSDTSAAPTAPLSIFWTSPTDRAMPSTTKRTSPNRTRS